MIPYQFAQLRLGAFFRSTSRMLGVLLLFSPSLLLLAFFALALIALPQGADLLVRTSESSHWYSGIIVLSSLFFWSYMLWYSSRIISYCKTKFYLQSSRFMFHIPRILGFYPYAILALAFYMASTQAFDWIKSASLPLLLIGVPFAYGALHRCIRLLSPRYQQRYGRKGLTHLFRAVFVADLLLITATALYPNSIFSMILTILAMLLCYLFLVINRKKIYGNYLPKSWQKASEYLLQRFFKQVGQQIPKTERHTFLLLQILAILATLIFLWVTIQVPAAMALGSIAILMLAFGFYTGLSNLVLVLSDLLKVNILFFLCLCLIVGAQLNDTHEIRTVPVKNLYYSHRQSFKQYLYQWLEQHRQELEEDSISSVPMIFVHSDGGASRSGYWVASVLNRLDSLSHQKLSANLFALSGASGGSLGNTTFYAQLFLQYRSGIDNREQTAQAFLQVDFLSYSLARMLGADVLNYIYPILPDRSRALEQSIEYGNGAAYNLDGFFALPFSNLLNKNNGKLLPILCINTTRMQDGRPAVISNVRLDSLSSGQRLDVLGLLPPGQDIRISTAVVMGARFPYISPAGAIRENGTHSGQQHYFVDGGYFDNSGAGMIHEMILELESIVAGDPYLHMRYGRHLAKLQYQVLHISNSPKRMSGFGPVNALLNDLAAPIITLVGAYSAQTSVNDYRLQSYVLKLQQQKEDNKARPIPAYYEINLYAQDTIREQEYYTMNWVISQHTLNRMQQRLEKHPGILIFAHYLDTLIPDNISTNSIYKPLNPYLYGLTNLSSPTTGSTCFRTINTNAAD